MKIKFHSNDKTQSQKNKKKYQACKLPQTCLKVLSRKKLKKLQENLKKL